MTEAEHNRPILKLFSNRPSASAAEVFGLQGIPAFRDFIIRDPLYFVILFEWKLAKKVDFRKFLKVRFLKIVQI